MARPPRTDFPGAWHHVMHRGARRAPIFERDEHCTLFLDTLGEAVERTGIEVHAYSLMPNHFHLLVRSPGATLSRAMKHLVGVYTLRINALNRWDGPIFRGRFRSELVESDSYLRYLFAYIHLNPVRAHLVARPDEPCWTSHRAHLGLEGAPPWLSRDAVKVWFGSLEAMADWTRELHIGREPWPEDMELDADLPLRHVPVASEPAPAAPAASPALAVDALLARVAAITGASLADLRSLKRGRGGNPARRFAAETLLRRGAFSHRDVADALGMTVKGVANMVHQAKNAPVSPQLTAWREQLDGLDASPPPASAR